MILHLPTNPSLPTFTCDDCLSSSPTSNDETVRNGKVSDPPEQLNELPVDAAVDLEKAGGPKETDGSLAVPTLYPEGGLQAWLTVLGAFLVMFSNFGYIAAFGVYESYYATHQFSSETSSNISWIGSFQMFLQFSMGAISGRLFDRGYFRLLMASGSFIYIAGLFLTSIAKTYWQVMLTQGVVMGLGFGLNFMPSIGIVGHYFHKKRSLAMGICVGGSSFGGVIFPIMLNRLFNSIGFGNGVRATGYLLLGCLVIANVIMKPRLPPQKKGVGPPPPSARSIFSEPIYFLCAFGFFFVAWGLYFPFFYLQVYAEANHLPEDVAFYSLSMLNAASIFGRTIPNALADHFGPFNMQLFCCSGASILVFAMFGAKTVPGAVIFAVLYGFFSGGYVSLLGPTLASTANHVSEIGIRMGLAMIVTGFAALSGTPISGALLTRTGNQFYAPILFAGISMSIGSSLILYARILQARKKGTWRV